MGSLKGFMTTFGTWVSVGEEVFRIKEMPYPQETTSRIVELLAKYCVNWKGMP
jgi:hypothetical protein